MKRNGRLVLAEARGGAHDKDMREGDDDCLSSEQNRAVTLRDAAGSTPVSRANRGNAGRSSEKSRGMSPGITPVTLNPSDLSHR